MNSRRNQNLKPFKKGQSGNPSGRPKELPELKELLADALADEKNGATQARKIVDKMVAIALKGDVKAARFLFERAYGLPKDNEGQPTELIIHVVRRLRERPVPLNE